MTTTQAAGGTLVWSAVPAANKALETGRDMLRATRRAEARQETWEQMALRPLPPEGTRERAWAATNRAMYRRETVDVVQAADRLTARYDALMGGLRQTDPSVAEAVEAAVWGKNQS